MIIALNGLPNSGKDTVGKIIQYLTRDKTICNFFYNIVTLEEGLNKIRNSNVEVTWQVKKFSKLPNKLYKKITGVDYLKLPRVDKERERPLFIKFCESMKHVFGTDVWASSLLKDYNKDCLWVITDLRFNAEYDELFLYTKVLLVHITSPNSIDNGVEDELSDVKWDYEIVNDGSLEDLVNKVQSMLNQFNI